MIVTAEMITTAHADAPAGYVRVSSSLIAGEPRSVQLGPIIGIEDERVYFANPDGFTYSTAARSDITDWEIVTTPIIREEYVNRYGDLAVRFIDAPAPDASERFDYTYMPADAPVHNSTRDVIRAAVVSAGAIVLMATAVAVSPLVARLVISHDSPVLSTVVSTPCPTEDSTECYWDAETMGNGIGTSH